MSRRSRATAGRPDKFMMKDIMRASYRDLFREAKEDLLATALWKSRLLTDPAASPQRPIAQKTADELWMKKFDEQRALTQDPKLAAGKGARLVVYDLEAPEYYRPAALILSEALREELFLLKQFTLVNREDIETVLREMALQQTGLIDEKGAVRTGKGLAASQVVTGKPGLLGRTFVFQAKRIDVETFATLGMAAGKFSQGREDEMLEKLPEMARSLAGIKK